MATINFMKATSNSEGEDSGPVRENVHMRSDNKQGASPADAPHNDSDANLSDRGYLWRIAIYMIGYGVVHLVLGIFVIYYPETIIDKWYYPVIYWTMATGPVAIALPWYLWARWKNAP